MSDGYTTTRVSEATTAKIEALQLRMAQRNYAVVAVVSAELRKRAKPSKAAVLEVALALLEDKMNAEDFGAKADAK